MERLRILSAFILLMACSSQPEDDPIPYIAFQDIVINLDQYASLRLTGGYAYVNGGVRGLIVYRSSNTTLIAYERNCSYRPNEACSTVEMDASGLFLYDPCCGSSFDLSTGTPTGGPAWRPLRQYRTVLQNNFLTITDEILE